MAKDGIQLEQLVHLIEKSISPDAEVEHNVQMPILNSRSGATTQCDIVIRSGKPPRQTITLVEVQDRGTKVKPNDFRGWKQKREDVGAQHLICVSKQEFPKSIKEQASLSGSSIMLVTLKEATPEMLPLGFMRFYYQFRNFDLIAITYMQPTICNSKEISLEIKESIHSRCSVESNEQCWSVDGQNLISLFVLCRDFYLPPDGVVSGSGSIQFDCTEGHPLYYFVNGIFIRVGLDCKFDWKNEIIEKPVSILTYEQDEHGALAWVAEVFHDSPKGKIVLRMPMTKFGDNYIVKALYAELPKDTTFSFGLYASE